MSSSKRSKKLPRSKVFILIAIAVIIFGPAAFFGYTLFLKPNGYTFTRLKQDPHAPVVAPTPDTGLEEFKAAFALQESGKKNEAKTAWQTWLQAFPQSPKKAEALAHLGKLNMEIICSPNSTDNKESYTVVRGDSLARIASRQKSDAELIQRINALPNINLQIGDVLLIPRLDISVDIDREAHTLTLNNHGQFLKSYTLLSNPGPSKTPIQTVVVDKIAMNDGKRAAFGSKKYDGSERTIILRSTVNIVTAPAEEVAKETRNNSTDTSTTTTNNTAASVSPASSATPTMPIGYVLSATDIDEIYPFVTRETPVTIR